MYKAAVDTESLQDPTIINNLKQLKVVIEYEPNSNVSKFHHVFFLLVNSQEIEKIANNMKRGWYSFFWDNHSLKVVFYKKTFNISLPGGFSSEEYKRLIDYGKKQGIEEEFLKIEKYFNRYKKLVEQIENNI
jgi:hypothetical protein